MKGVVYLGEGEVEVREFPDPKPGPNEVLIQMGAAGLCGSDLHKYHKTREWASERNAMIAGHEPSGVVVELGLGVTDLRVGDRVSVYHSLGCGHCRYCLAGTPAFCRNEGAFGRTRDGCHADFMTTPSRYCLPLPDEFSLATGAALACTGGTAFSAILKLPLQHGQTLVVFGLGPVGLTGLLMGQAMGFRCIGVDVKSYRLDLAATLFDGLLINGGTTDAVEVVMDATHGEGAPGILECSGSGVARRQASELAATMGWIIIVGAGSDPINLDVWTVIEKALTLKANRVNSFQDYYEAVDFLKTHPIPLDDMITHRFKIDDAVQAFEIFDSGNTGKVIFEWD